MNVYFLIGHTYYGITWRDVNYCEKENKRNYKAGEIILAFRVDPGLKYDLLKKNHWTLGRAISCILIKILNSVQFILISNELGMDIWI